MTTYKDVFQLAQDKGYRLLCAKGISDDGMMNIGDQLWGDEGEAKNYPNRNDLLIKSLIELTLIAKWLREEYKIYVDVALQLVGRYSFALYNTGNGSIVQDHPKYEKWLPSYEDSLLNGINEALNLI